MGGAAAVCAALELLPALAGGERRAVRVWAIAGVAGAALGPAVGGLLTQLISWQSIFVAQVPLALIPALVVFGRCAPLVATRAGRPHIAANVALGLLSAGLAAVLFLLVLLLVEGWRMPPISAALVVTAMPARGPPLGPVRRARVASPRTRAAAGTLLGAGGVAALGLLPGAGWAWTLAPQLLVGAGLALSLGALTEAALAGRSPAAIPRRGHDRRAPRRRRARARAADARVRRRPRPPARARDAEGRRARTGRAHRRAHQGRARLSHRGDIRAGPGGYPTSTGSFAAV